MKRMGIVLLAAFVLTGCVQAVELTDQESRVIAEYAAHVTLQHDRKYMKKLEEAQAEEEKKEEAAVPEEEQPAEENQEAPKEAGGEEAPANIADTVKMSDFSVAYEGISYEKQYPQDEEIYSVKSGEGKEFLVIHINITNETDETRLCDVLSYSPKFSVSINGEEPVRAYSTLLDNDFSTLCNEVEGRATLASVLLVEIDESYHDRVETVELHAEASGQTTIIKLQ